MITRRRAQRVRTSDSRPVRTPSAARRAFQHVPPLRGLLPLALALALWQVVAASDSPYFPPPSSWLAALGGLATSGTLWPALWSTVVTFLIGLALATVIGSVVGGAVGRSHAVDRLLGPLLEYCRVMPAPAIVPLAVLFGGYSETAKLAVVTFLAAWPILLQVRAAARGIPPPLLDVAQIMRLGRWATITKIVVPAVRAGALVGVRVAAPVALVATLLVELLTAIPGLGALIGAAQDKFDASAVYGLVAIGGIMGALISMTVFASEGGLARAGGGDR